MAAQETVVLLERVQIPLVTPIYNSDSLFPFTSTTLQKPRRFRRSSLKSFPCFLNHFRFLDLCRYDYKVT